jgi:hypothetical protein
MMPKNMKNEKGLEETILENGLGKFLVWIFQQKL